MLLVVVPEMTSATHRLISVYIHRISSMNLRPVLGIYFLACYTLIVGHPPSCLCDSSVSLWSLRIGYGESMSSAFTSWLTFLISVVLAASTIRRARLDSVSFVSAHVASLLRLYPIRARHARHSRVRTFSYWDRTDTNIRECLEAWDLCSVRIRTGVHSAYISRRQ